jgi:signal peptidase II
VFYILTLAIFILDQAIKIQVHSLMQVNQSVPIMRGILHLTYVQNHGAAFGIFGGWRGLLILIGFMVIVIIFYMKSQLAKGDFSVIALAFILGGSLGNLCDRMVRSFVIDYIDLRIWPVFNLADVMINLGAILIIIRIFSTGKEKNVS